MAAGNSKPELPPELVARWTRAATACLKDPSEDLLQDLARRLQSEDRHYHNVEHVAHVIDVLGDAPDPRLILCAWLHDAVYDAKAKDNEAKSAELARTELSARGASEEDSAFIERVILATQSHDAGGDELIARFLDADLAILGADPNRYRAYAAAIRREYHWVDDEAYRKGRRKVLQSFQEREIIYHTPEIREQLEMQARKNIHAELKLLL